MFFGEEIFFNKVSSPNFLFTRKQFHFFENQHDKRLFSYAYACFQFYTALLFAFHDQLLQLFTQIIVQFRWKFEIAALIVLHIA